MAGSHPDNLSDAVDIADAADKSFSKARREAMLRRTWAITRNSLSSTSLLSFDEVRPRSGRLKKIPLGERDTPIEQIAGSVSRSRDFDNLFLPLRGDLRYRWTKVYKDFQASDLLGRKVPPVTLYRINESYFVEDGNHRVSVARFRGRSSIRAKITLLVPNPKDSREKRT